MAIYDGETSYPNAKWKSVSSAPPDTLVFAYYKAKQNIAVRKFSNGKWLDERERYQDTPDEWIEIPITR